MSCPLPHVPLSDFVKQSFAHYGLDAKIEQKSKFRFRGGDPRYAASILTSLFDAYSIPLRTAQQIITKLAVTFGITDPNSEVYAVATSTLLVLEHLNEPLIRAFERRQTTSTDVVDWIRGSEGGMTLLDSEEGYHIEMWLHAIFCTYGLDAFAKLRELARQEDDATPQRRAQRIVAMADRIVSSLGDHTLEYVAKKIRLSGEFVTSTQA